MIGVPDCVYLLVFIFLKVAVFEPILLYFVSFVGVDIREVSPVPVGEQTTAG
jgi:hypothetical protein